MSYTVAPETQLGALLVFLGAGFLLGVLYETVIFVRTLISERKRAIMVQDVIFCALAFLVLFFSFLAYADGVLRPYLLLSAAVGFLAFRLTVGKMLKRCFASLASGVHAVLSAVFRPFVRLASLLKDRLSKVCGKLCSAVAAVRQALRQKRSAKTAAKAAEKGEVNEKNVVEIEKKA